MSERLAQLTSIELAADAGTLIGASVHGTTVKVTAIERFERRSAPGTGGFTRALEQARGMLDLPRRTRVVLWDGRAAAWPAAPAAVQPLTAAGFEIDRIVSPCDALAALARSRQPRPAATMLWLAINRTHVAMVVMQPGRMLYSYFFPWDSTMGSTGSQAKLLQRYTRVAYLAPEVHRAVVAARAAGAEVDGIITCGDLPELRSLTMPLIEELDLEVETLDSTAEIEVAPWLTSSVVEIAPAIRLAMAGAVARSPRPRQPWARVHAMSLSGAAAAAALGGAVWWWLGRPEPLVIPPEISSAARRSDVNLPAPPPPPSPPADVRETATPPPSSVSETLPRAVVPHVSAILTSDDRRIALVDGRIVRVGDRIGPWRVTAIEPHAVVLTDASGAELRVRLGGR